ncbi:hypothetical protein D3C87_916340 [compost metagenome]
MFFTQLLAPVIELTLALAGFQPAALPDRIVGVLQRQRRQLRFAFEAEGLIALDEFLDHHVHRPAVRDDVVHAHHQHEFLVGQGKQTGAQQRPVAQIERPCSDGLHLLRQRLLAFCCRQAGQVDTLHGQRLLFKDHLMRLITVSLEHRAQDLMARHQMIEGALQRRFVQTPVQAQAGGHVVSSALRFELPEKQQALLSERQRNRRDIVTTDRQRQQAEVLAIFAQLGQKQPTLFQRQADEPLRDTFRHCAAHTSSPSKALMN